jgi:predicted N-acetyltransferase YhbS
MNNLLIRPFQPADSVSTCELFRRVYGDHYVSPDVYMPQMICQHNLQERWHSLVAVTGDRVVGHAALCRHAKASLDAELALIAVDPDLQGRHIASRPGARARPAIDQTGHEPSLQPTFVSTAGI